jgi:hypothetical protein
VGDHNRAKLKKEASFIFLKAYFFLGKYEHKKNFGDIILTIQMLHFGTDRGNFSSIVNRGDIVLRHLLLENWDASKSFYTFI